MLLRNKIVIGIILYIIPFISVFLIYRLYSLIVESSHSIENAIYAYFIYITLLIVSFLSSAYIAKSKKQLGWGVKFFFAIIAIMQFIPVMILALFGAGLISVNNLVAKIAPISLYYRIKQSKFNCTVTSIIAAVSAFSLMLFIKEEGNIKTTKKIKKAVLAVHHLSSGDYFVAGILAIFYNWRVMIGANLWKYKIFHFFFDAVGVPIEREATANKKRAEAVQISKDFLINNKYSRLIVFPFGTRERNPEKGVYGLKTGAFRIAQELAIDVIPVTIIGTNKWRRPWDQDTSTHKGKKHNPVKLIWSYLYQFFKTGITPTIVTVVYGNPISTVGKTMEEVKDEVEKVMDKTYLDYTQGKIRHKRRRARRKLFKEAS